MIRRLFDEPLSRATPQRRREDLSLQLQQEEALERLIAALEIAVAQMGWIYRPPSHISTNRLNQLARLSAAHAAYVLASRSIPFPSGIWHRTADSPVRPGRAVKHGGPDCTKN